LRDATNDVRAKQKALNDAVNGYGADSDQAKAAQRELSKAQRNVAEAGFRIEESVFAVRDAEKKLADLRKDPEANAQDIRQAEIDLEQAKLAVADATDSQFDATEKLKEAQLLLNEAVDGAAVGSETYKKFLIELNDAKTIFEKRLRRLPKQPKILVELVYLSLRCRLFQHRSQPQPRRRLVATGISTSSTLVSAQMVLRLGVKLLRCCSNIVGSLVGTF
jgi:chromosome segregation ATPase